jgi:transposase
VRARIDWKYALGLELTDEGFHYSARSRVPDTPRAGQHGAGTVGHLAQAVPRTGLAQSTWAPAS